MMDATLYCEFTTPAQLQGVAIISRIMAPYIDAMAVSKNIWIEVVFYVKRI